MSSTSTNTSRWGLIAGNGRFPFLVLEGARSQGIEMVVIAIKEEAAPELVPQAGVLTRRAPSESEAADIEYGLGVARQIAAMDVGQTVVISDKACVAVEAMEGTDETIARAGRLVAGKQLVVVKVSKPKQDMRFDVPVVGLPTIQQMRD